MIYQTDIKRKLERIQYNLSIKQQIIDRTHNRVHEQTDQEIKSSQEVKHDKRTKAIPRNLKNLINKRIKVKALYSLQYRKYVLRLTKTKVQTFAL